jgi:radical SAM superfamily enzyme YgiQ (UPF0313 family)
VVDGDARSGAAVKIALIAMSGVRAYSEPLTQLGMSLPGFADRARAIESLPSLSLLTIAALTPDRHELTYHEITDVDRLSELPGCDLAAIATFTAKAPDAYRLAERYRDQGVTTVIGGLHVTAVPKEAMEHCDAVVVGEGELSWPRLVEDLDAGRLQPIYDARGMEFDLADAPIPRFDLVDRPHERKRLTIQTQRGCPWRCDFCASSIRLTRRYKVKPADRVAAEIRAIKEVWPEPFIELADDNTFVDRRRSRTLVETLGEAGVPWFTESDVGVADDPELVAMMADAGCAEVLIGFESPTASGLDGIELRRNWKRRRLDGYRAAIDLLQSNGIAVNACFVLGLDGDGPEVFDAVHRFVEETQPFDVQLTVMTPFPGTPLYERLLREGRILHVGDWARCTLFDVNFRPARMSVRELEEGLLRIGLPLFSEGATRRRRASFKRQAERRAQASPTTPMAR